MVLFHLMILHLVIKQSKVAILGMNLRELKSEHATASGQWSNDVAVCKRKSLA